MLLAVAASAFGQEIIVNVSPKYSPMPPYAGLYIDDLGKFFTVTLTNPTDEPVQVFLGFQIEQLTGGNFHVSTPVRRQPSKPFVLGRGSHTMTKLELKELFREVNINEVSVSGGSLTDFTSGAVGLLPEGNYQGFLTVYQWNPGVYDPQALSNPNTGQCYFDVCYHAPAPEIVSPAENVLELDSSESFADGSMSYPATTVDFNVNPTFSWTPSNCPCAATFQQPTYDIEFFELRNGMSPEETVTYGRNSYTFSNIKGASYTPALTLTQRKLNFIEDNYYVMRVVARSPQTDSKESGYIMIENEGYSPLRIIRIKKYDVAPDAGGATPGTGGEEKKKEEVKKDTTELEVNLTVPKLTAPKNSGDLLRQYSIQKGKDVRATWEAPKFVSGVSEIGDTIKHYTYNASIYPVKTGYQEVDSILKARPLVSKKDLPDSLGITFKWAEIEKAKIEVNQQYALIVTAKPTYIKKDIFLKGKKGEDGVLKPDTLIKIKFSSEPQNVYSFVLPPDFSTADDCYLDAKVSDDKASEYSLEKFKEGKLAIGEFDLYVTKAEKNSKFTGIRPPENPKPGEKPKKIDGPAYKGEGYIVWRPYGKDIKIAVEFDSLLVNKDRIVVEGNARSARQKEDNIPYDMLDGWTKNIGVESADYKNYMGGIQKAAGDYWQYVHGSMGYGNTIMQIVDGCVSTDLNAPPVTLPLSMGALADMVPDGIPCDLSLLSMRFSPTNASLDLLLMAQVPKNDVMKGGEQVLGFAAPGLCITPDSPWAKSGRIGLMYDLTLVDGGTGYEFTFNAPTSYKDIKDGTFVEWKDGKFERMRIDFKMNVQGLLPDDGSGHIVAGQKGVELGFAADVKDWNDWTASSTVLSTVSGQQVRGFQVEEAEGYTFIPGGKIVIDHSTTMNEDGMVIPQGYDWQKYGLTKEEAADKKNFVKWQGLFVQDIGCKFPIELTKKDGDDAKADKRLGIDVKNMLIDKKGISCTGTMTNVLKSGSMSSFSLSVDEIYLNIIQNNFSNVGFKGVISVPLLNGGKNAKGEEMQAGTFDYDAKFQYAEKPLTQAEKDKQKKDAEKKAAEGETAQAEEKKEGEDKKGDEEKKEREKEWSFIFSCVPKTDIVFDFFLADLTLDKNGTYLKVQGSTHPKVEFITSGAITVSSRFTKDKNNKPKLGFELPGIHFAGMRVASYAYDAEDKKRFSEAYVAAINKAKAGYTAQVEYNKSMGEKTDALTDPYAWLKKDDVAAYSKKIDEAIKSHEIHSPSGELYFSIGSWSLASMEKTLWGIPFTLKKLQMKSDGDKAGLYVNGGVNMIGNEKFGIGAQAGLTVWAKVDWKELDVSYDRTEFNDIELQGSFGGAVTVDGKLSISKDDDKEGFDGKLKVGVKGLFTVDVSGGYYNVKKTAADMDKDSAAERAKPNYDDHYKAGYFFGSVKDIPAIGPVSLEGVQGGFYFNYAARTSGAKDRSAYIEKLKTPTLCYGVAGGAFGFGLVAGDKSLIKGDMTMNILINMKKSKVEEFHMQGNVHALCGSASAEKGLINAQADILYRDETTDKKLATEKKVFKLNLTMDMDLGTKQLYEQFTGSVPEIPDAVANASAFDMSESDDQGDNSNGSDKSTTNANGSRDKSKAEKEAESNGYIKGASASIGLEFQFQSFPYADKAKNKWHLYLGEPDVNKRCRITFIDFALGKDKPVGVWAKAYANFYVCLGNELPGDGKLPDLPAEVSEALGGKGADGTKHPENMSKLEAARQQVLNGGPKGSINGGVMIGAAIGAEFGCNAIFCYANVEGMLGFDAVLKQFDANAKCSDGSRMGGKNGFYATGQIYAMLKGEVGLMLDLWIFKGKVPLVDMTLGALLQGGVPNPTWAYGKVRAKGSILKGLIKFNSSIELKVGRVCLPAYGNPLDDIKIFGDVAPGQEKMKDGWDGGQKVSPYGNVTFTTNMRIDSKMNLVDEGAAAQKAGMGGDVEKYKQESMRTYVFRLDKQMKLEKFQNSSSDKDSNREGEPRWCEYKTLDHENYTLKMGSMEANSFYKVTLTGYAKEIRNGMEVDPVFNDSTTNYKDVSKAWTQTAVSYFCTDKYSDNMYDEVAAHLPAFDANRQVVAGGAGATVAVGSTPLSEAGSPMIMLLHKRKDYWENPDYEFDAEYLFQGDNNQYKPWVLPDIKYNSEWQRLPGQTSKFENLKLKYVEETGVDEDGKKFVYATVVLQNPIPYSAFVTNRLYSFAIYRTNLKKMDEYFDNVRETYKNIMKAVSGDKVEAAKTLAAMKADSSNPLQQELAKYYYDMESAYGSNTAEQRIREYKDNMLKNTDAFREKVYYLTFTTGDKNTPKEQGLENIIALNDQIATHFRFRKVNYSNSSPYTKQYNPYVALNYWQSRAGIIASNLPGFVLNDKISGALLNFDWKSTAYPMYRNGENPDLRKYTDAEYRNLMDPSCKNTWVEPILQTATSVGGSRYTSPVANWQTMFWMDAMMAERLEESIREKWNSYTGSSSVATLKSKSTSDKVFSTWKSRVKNTSSTYSFTDYFDEDGQTYEKNLTYQHVYDDYQKSEFQWGYWQVAYMYAATDDRMKLTSTQLNTTTTNQGYYMSGYYSPFKAENFLKNIASIEYDVRRCTGYNTLTGDMGIRPSTQGDYQAHVEKYVTYTEVSGTNFQGGLRNPWTWDGTKTTSEDYVYIPDDIFRKKILALHDENKDGKLQKSEALKITAINMPKLGIKSVQGIESMTNLVTLNLSNNELAEVNLTFNTKLKEVYLNNMGSYGLTSIDVSTLSDLRTLSIYGHYMTSGYNSLTRKYGLKTIDVSKNTQLTKLDCSWNQLTSLDVSSNKMLETLSCEANMIGTLSILDNTHLKNLTTGRQYVLSAGKYVTTKTLTLNTNIYYDNDELLVKLNNTGGRPIGYKDTTNGKDNSSVSGNVNANVFYRTARGKSLFDLVDKQIAIYLIKKYGTKKSSTKLSGETENDSAYVRRNYTLTDWTEMQKLTSLTISELGVKKLDNLGRVLPDLTELRVSKNELTSIDLSEFTKLTTLYCSNNSIQNIKFAENSALMYLFCSNNDLVALDCSNQKKLVQLYADGNSLSEINLTGTNITYLKLADNQFEELDLSDRTTLKQLDVSHNPFIRRDEFVTLTLPTNNIMERLVMAGLQIGNADLTRFTNLKYLDLTDCDIMQWVAFSKAKIETLKLENCGNLRTINGNTADHLGTILSQMPAIKSVYMANSCKMNKATSWYLTTANTATYIDIHDCNINYVGISGCSDKQIYCGVPNRLTGSKVRVVFWDDASMATWSKYKNNAKNQYAVGYRSNTSPSNSEFVLEQITESDLLMQDMLGPTAYNYLKEKYAKDKRAFHTTDASALREVDLSAKKITSFKALKLYFYNLEKLNISANYIKEADLSGFKNLTTLDISHNTDLSTLTLPTSIQDVNISSTAVDLSVLTSACTKATKSVIARDCGNIKGTMTLSSSYKVKELTLVNTGVNILKLSNKYDLEKLEYRNNTSDQRFVVMYNSCFGRLTSLLLGSKTGMSSLMLVSETNNNLACKWYNTLAKDDIYSNNVNVYVDCTNQANTSGFGSYTRLYISPLDASGNFKTDDIVAADMPIIKMAGSNHPTLLSSISKDAKALHKTTLANVKKLILSGKNFQIPVDMQPYFTSLRYLNLNGSTLASIDVSKLAIDTLYLPSCKSLTSLTLPNQLSYISVANCTSLSAAQVNSAINRAASVAIGNNASTSATVAKTSLAEKVAVSVYSKPVLLTVAAGKVLTNVTLSNMLYTDNSQQVIIRFVTNSSKNCKLSVGSTLKNVIIQCPDKATCDYMLARYNGAAVISFYYKDAQGNYIAYKKSKVPTVSSVKK